MNPIFKKLNLKGESLLLVQHAPESFEANITELDKAVEVHQNVITDAYPFVLIFARAAADITEAAERLKGKLAEDAKFWIAYPKKSSKNYTTDISRDQGWQPLGDMGYEGVRQVAIDSDWSALRFRHVDHIKSMKRDKSRAMSKKGKKRVE